MTTDSVLGFDFNPTVLTAITSCHKNCRRNIGTGDCRSPGLRRSM